VRPDGVVRVWYFYCVSRVVIVLGGDRICQESAIMSHADGVPPTSTRPLRTKHWRLVAACSLQLAASVPGAPTSNTTVQPDGFRYGKRL
jgi:hypothetical protein